MRRSLPFLSLVLAATLGCAPGGPGAAPAPSSRNVLTAEELGGVPHDDAYDAIGQLRPRWITPRAGGGLRIVFIDNVGAGTLERLRTIPLQIGSELRFIDSRDATTRWGTGYPDGVIHVITRPS